MTKLIMVIIYNIYVGMYQRPPGGVRNETDDIS